MIDTRIIQALTSSDPDKRKKAVAYLAKSLDRDALPHLARVSASDKDPQIRELAKKAMAYIEKNAPQPEPAYDDDDDDLYADEPTYADEEDDDDDVYTPSSRYSSLYDDAQDDEPDEDEIDVPLPADIQVSAVAEERAKSYVNQAIDWSERGNSSKAVDMLKQAFKLNPRLFYESYSMGVAQNITGMTKGDTQRLLMPSARDLKRMGVSKDEKSAKEPTKLNIFQQFFALVVFLGATATLISFFAMPWMDFSDLPVPPQAGMSTDANTLGAQLAEGKALFDGLFGQFEPMLNQIGGETAALLRRLVDSIRSIRATTTGMDVMLLVLGSQNALEAFGYGGIFSLIFDSVNMPEMRDTIMQSTNQFTDSLGLPPNATPQEFAAALRVAIDLTKYPPQSLDYSIIAVPVVASFAFLLSLLLFMTPSNTIWVLNILIGLIGVGACAYFYTTGFDRMIMGDANSATTLQLIAGQPVSLPEGISFIGLGFWVSMGGMIAVAIAPFWGLLFAPAKKTE